jgi:hypothetical protein
MKEKRLEPAIAIRLKGLGQTHVFHPSDTLSGVVEIQPDNVIKCRQVVLSVGWHTEGRGDINQMSMHEERLPVTEISPDAPLAHQFDVVLPPEPWSYAGALIRIVWQIHVKVDIALGSDMNEYLQFVLEPPPLE